MMSSMKYFKYPLSKNFHRYKHTIEFAFVKIFYFRWD